MRHGHALGLLVGLAATSFADVSSGFTQFETAPGHDIITHDAAVAAGGAFTEPASNQLDLSTAWCGPTCFDYHTKSWKTWSVIMGNRWTDIGGYNAVDEIGKAKAIGRSTDCFNATMQDPDDVQYAHALRKRGDTGPAGLQQAYNGTVEFIRKRFMEAVDAPESTIWILDGGTSVSPRKVNRPYFLLGMSLHALQDLRHPLN